MPSVNNSEQKSNIRQQGHTIYAPMHIGRKGLLDKWLRTIPDTLKIENYGKSIPAESNIICDQAGDPNFG